jgi:glyoxylase I family protein
MKFFVFILLLFSINGFAQENSVKPFFSAVIVQDMDASIDWYEGVLEFSVASRTDNEERGLRQANLVNSETVIELIEISSSIGIDEIQALKPNTRYVQGFFKFGLIVDDFDGWEQRLKQKGVEFRGESMYDSLTQRSMMIILDPDGNRIQLFSPVH